MFRLRTVVICCIAGLIGFMPLTGRTRSLDFWESWSGGLHGGLQNLSVYHAGLQVLTLGGPGDSALLGGHLGLGLDTTYLRIGQTGHHLRVQPMAELLLLCFVWVHAGIGADVDLTTPDNSGLALMLGTGLRLFFGDEYQSPSLSLGGRFDWSVASRSRFVPSAFAQLSFYIDP